MFALIYSAIRRSLILVLPVLAIHPARGAEISKKIPLGLDLSLRLEVKAAIQRGSRWLIENQAEDGSWSNPDHPALTALSLVALQRAPGNQDEAAQKAIRRGYDFLEASIQPDGGIYRTDMLQNYNTAISLMALLAADRTDYDEKIRNARQFLIQGQFDLGEPGKIDTPLDGGVGYGSSDQHSDLSNTVMALEALYYSRHLARDQKDSPLHQLNWDAAIHFVQNCQNLPEFNSQPWASGDPENRGGFIYCPGESKAGEQTLSNGRTALRSYGSISYAGLLSYIYADLAADDPRVAAALDWLEKNYTLEENPGMGLQGLYYYYHTMTKALTAAGVNTLTPAGGKPVAWRHDLALTLLNHQKENGRWVNSNGRWWEKDPVLVSAYVLISLEMLLG